MHETYGIMGMAGVGFFGMLIIGFIAGYIAERVMQRDHGLLTNILVGVAGSFVGGTLAGLLGIQFYGLIGNLVIATLGAIGILWFFGSRGTRTITPPGTGGDINSGIDSDPMYRGRRDE